MPSVQIKRGTRSQLDTAKSASGLKVGELYLITDENRVAVGTAVNDYVDVGPPLIGLVGVNDQTGTTYTLVLGDAGKDVRCTNAAAITLTVPPNSSVAFRVGTLIVLSQGGAGVVTATAGAGVTLRAANGAATTAQYDGRVLEKTDTDTWRVW